MEPKIHETVHFKSKTRTIYVNKIECNTPKYYNYYTNIIYAYYAYTCINV